MPGWTGGGANNGDARTNTETEAETAEPQAAAEEPTTETSEGEAPSE